MHLSLILQLLLPLGALSFTVLPYIQIDYAHYFRLAQCQAKCTEKYGQAAKHTLLDGTVEEYFENLSEAGKMCEHGCQQHRRSHKKVTRSTKASLHEGAKFWIESSADSAKVGSSPVASVELLCQNPSVNDEMEDSSEGIVGLRLVRPSGAVRYVVQWKQRTYALGFYDESQWITASIESSSTFTVEGLIPGVQYKFMITVVGVNGRLGDTVVSEWAEIGSTAAIKAPGGPLVVKNGYNSDHGVYGHLFWSRTAYDSCRQRLELVNSTHHVTKDISLDASVSILLPHLEFDAHYTVSLSGLSIPRDNLAPVASRPLMAKFHAFECSKVHGKGSLMCVPEPVTEIKVITRLNGTATVSWTPSASVDKILTYQVLFQSSTTNDECQTEQGSVYLKAASTSANIDLPGNNCEYTIRVLNYDLMGREAVAEARVHVEFPHFSSLFQWEFVLIALCLSFVVFLVILIRCTLTKKCPVRVSEKSDKLTDSYA